MFNSTTQELKELHERLSTKPDLCHKCGRCCTSATSYHTHASLQQMAAEGRQDAAEFLEVFQPFPSIEEARKVVPEQVEQVLNIVEQRDDMKVEDVTFYHCRYVTEEGLCGIYERRPACCRMAPSHGWDVMPPGCGFEGWQFYQRENQKSYIRKLKEVQFQMEMLSPDGVRLPSRDMTLDVLRASVTEAIGPWKTFGSPYW